MCVVVGGGGGGGGRREGRGDCFDEQLKCALFTKYNAL